MFEQVLGIPAHPLLLHAAVVFIPLLALGAIAYAVVPALRARIRWEVALLAVVGAGSAVLTKLSGDAFFRRMHRLNQVSGSYQTKISQHQSLGTITMWVTIALAVVTLLLVFLLAPARRDGAATTARLGAPRLLNVLLGVVAVGLSAASLYYVFRTGDLGAHIVWQGR